MSLEESIAQREIAIIGKLREQQGGVSDATGKGLTTESIVDDDLVKPFLPPRFSSAKGAVVTSRKPDEQSSPIDRVIYDNSAAPPLIYGAAHSVFPIEAVCGLVEITMYLDATKLRTDIERMAPIKAMQTRRYFLPISLTQTKVVPHEVEDAISPRSFIVGLPSDMNWTPHAIATSLRQIQIALGSPTHVHGLYVLGIGFFETVPVENVKEPMYRIRAWVGNDRLFRFADSFRRAFDRWEPLPPLCSVDLTGYVKGESTIMAE